MRSRSRPWRLAFERCAALRARTGGPADENAPCWPAAMAGEAHPVPSRTRKLSPLAPMVLRCSPWESRTPPASKGRFPSHVLRPAPGRPGAGLFCFCRAARERTSPVSPGACARAALLLLPGASPSRLFRSRRSAADRQDDGKGRSLPVVSPRGTRKRRKGTVPSHRFSERCKKTTKGDRPFPSFRARAIGLPRGGRRPRSWSGSRVRLRDSPLSRYCDLEGSTLRLPSWCRNDCLK